jgi:hypothetical protein
MNAAYKAQHGGHHYHGRNIGRGCRRASKIAKAVNGVASTDFMNEIAREDEMRQREGQNKNATECRRQK